MVNEFKYKNALDLEKMPKDIEIKTFPKEMMSKAKIALEEILEEESKKNNDFKLALQSYQKFSKLNRAWDDISTKHLLGIR